MGSTIIGGFYARFCACVIFTIFNALAMASYLAMKLYWSICGNIRTKLNRHQKHLPKHARTLSMQSLKEERMAFFCRHIGLGLTPIARPQCQWWSLISFVVTERSVSRPSKSPIIGLKVKPALCISWGFPIIAK